jgi:transcriptional regulator with XRE-family HTH domain
MSPAELARYEKGLSIDDAARLSGVNARTIRRIERGETKPSASTARALADTYEVTVAELLGVKTEPAA